MPLIYCPECGNKVSEHASTCPQCGYPIGIRKGNMPPPPTPNGPNFYYNRSWFDDFLSGNSGYYYTREVDKDSMINQFLFINGAKFPQYRLPDIERKLRELDVNELRNMALLSFRSPTVMLIISVLIGYLGVDRFLLDDITNGVIKLILTICCGLGLVWWIVDLFLIMNLTREYNYRIFLQNFNLIR